MSVIGVIRNGVVVLPDGISFSEGTRVEVILRELVPKAAPLPSPPLEPRDEWERRLLAIATDCGMSLSNEALSSEGLYD